MEGGEMAWLRLVPLGPRRLGQQFLRGGKTLARGDETRLRSRRGARNAAARRVALTSSAQLAFL